MNDLFRFLQLRPAEPPKPDDVRPLAASYVEKGASRELAKRLANQFASNKAFVLNSGELAYASAARAVYALLRAGPAPAAIISNTVKTVHGNTAKSALADKVFVAEEVRLVDTLVTMKLLSDSSGADAPALLQITQGYQAIRLAASGRDPVSLPVLFIEDFVAADSVSQPLPAITQSSPGQLADDPVDLQKQIDKIDAALAALGTLPAAGFEAPATRETETAQLRQLDSRLAALERPSETATRSAGSASPITANARPWMLSAQTISGLPIPLRNILSEVGVDLSTQTLPMALNTLHLQKSQQTLSLENQKTKPTVALGRVHLPDQGYVGTPSAPLPSGHGNIKPIGIGDLLLVKQHVLRYQGGDLAHVENVLKSEHLSRDTRRLERTETTIVKETETTKEEVRDTQTTDRFSLKRETSDTIKTDSSLKAGISVDAKYGPFVEVKANADIATSTSTESSTKQATEFSKDVVARSASKLVERVLERRSTTTINEFEEKYSHGFDNTAGSGHISGFYQWIDKVMQAQVYNYGKRLLFDVTVPEPGTNYILAQGALDQTTQNLKEPPPFTLTADQIDENNYALWAHKYEVGGLEAPPPPWKTVSKAIDATVNQNPHESTKSETLAIDDGYRAKYAYVRRSYFWVDSATGINAAPVLQLVVGSNALDLTVTEGHIDMASEVGSVPISYTAYKIELLAINIEIFCELTDRAVIAWRLKTHAAITQGYQAKRQAYEQALAQAKAAAGVVISGRNPMFNAQIIASELRKQCLTLVTAQQFDAFGALEISKHGQAQPNLARTASQMPYIRFFEQAFEWEHILYFFYPYFWGWKTAWNKRMFLDDVDPSFADFLRAGAARVVFPVRPGFEAAVIHFLETGEIWNGGPPPDISSSLYVPIIKEIQEATGAPGDETPVGEPWLIDLPTTLVRIRPNNDLPTWKKVGEDWQATN
jgi:hypothetical protein